MFRQPPPDAEPNPAHAVSSPVVYSRSGISLHQRRSDGKALRRVLTFGQRNYDLRNTLFKAPHHRILPPASLTVAGKPMAHHRGYPFIPKHN